MMARRISLLIGIVLIVSFAVGCGQSSSTTTTTSSTTTTTSGGGSHNLRNIFFLHHSTGRELTMGFYEDEYPLGSPEAIGVRKYINNYNTSHGTSFRYWDHDYNNIGVTDPDGNLTGYSYNIPNGPHGDEGDTSPEGLHTLWTSTDAVAVAARTRILASHEVIAFKSCFSEASIADENQLDTYKNYYLDMRQVFDAHPEKFFVVISFPPLHRNTPEYPDDIAANTRSFANWLKSTGSGGFLNGNHPNIACFDLFDYLAAASTEASGVRDRLKQVYEFTAIGDNSHPNSLAATTVGQIFGAFLINKALSY